MKAERALWALIAGTYLLALGLVSWRFAPPAPVDAASSATSFSAPRALEAMRRVLPERPHPVASADNREVKERLRALLEERGYATRVERHVVCSRYAFCTPVENVVATIGEGADVLLLMVHYDSVGAGPGVSDDGAGVGVLLDMALLLQQAPPAHNTVALLFTDGEEAGLLGARAFMEHDPLAARVAAVINVEARGSGGPSLMFETSGPTAPIASLLSALPRPATSALFSAVYERMPNDTDFSVLKQRGIPGFNFAFIEGVSHYHTPRDDFDHLSLGSLQHHGDNVKALVDRLAGAPLSSLRQGGDAVWFDFLSFAVIAWPKPWSLPLALLAPALLAVAAWRARARPGYIAAAAGWTLAALIAAIAMAWLFAWALDAGHDSPLPRTAKLTLPVAGIAALCAAAVFGLATRGGGTPRERYLGVWACWSLFACALGHLFAEASYLFIAPALVAAVLAAASARLDALRLRLVSLAAALVAACMWLQVAAGLIHGVGLMGHPAISLTLALAWAPAAPALAGVSLGRRAFAYGIGFAACALVAALILPRHDRDDPQPLNILHHQSDDAASWWIDASHGPLPAAVAALAPPADHIAPPLPWAGFRRVAVSPAPRHDAPPPQASVTPAGQVSEVWIDTPRGADIAGVALAEGCPLVRVDRATVRPYRTGSGHHVVAVATAGAPRVGLVVARSCRIEAVFDIRRSLPPFAAPLADARGDAAVPAHNGDLSIVWSAWQ